MPTTLTEQMGGEIGFESAPGQGSRFHFTVRLQKGAEIVRPWMSASAVSCFKGLRVMVVNDSPASRQVIVDYVSSWGVKNVTADGGADALAMLKREPAGDDENQSAGRNARHLSARRFALLDAGEIPAKYSAAATADRNRPKRIRQNFVRATPRTLPLRRSSAKCV